MPWAPSGELMLCCLADVVQLEGGVEDLFEHRNVEQVACRVSMSDSRPSLMQRAPSIAQQRALEQGRQPWVAGYKHLSVCTFGAPISGDGVLKSDLDMPHQGQYVVA